MRINLMFEEGRIPAFGVWSPAHLSWCVTIFGFIHLFGGKFYTSVNVQGTLQFFGIGFLRGANRLSDVALHVSLQKKPSKQHKHT